MNERPTDSCRGRNPPGRDSPQQAHSRAPIPGDRTSGGPALISLPRCCPQARRTSSRIPRLSSARVFGKDGRHARVRGSASFLPGAPVSSALRFDELEGLLLIGDALSGRCKKVSTEPCRADIASSSWSSEQGLFAEPRASGPASLRVVRYGVCRDFLLRRRGDEDR